MPIERGLQFSMALMVFLGTLVLGMGEDNPVIPILGAIAVCGAVYLTDIKGWLVLNNAMSNVAGASTLVICLFELRRVGPDSQALALANLLFYLQCVLLFRPKLPRVYWLIALLSLLQVAVAAALNDGMLFGLLLVIYCFVGLVTLTLFLFQQELVRQRSAVGTDDTPASGFQVLAAAEADTVPPLGLARTLAGMTFSSLLMTGVLFLAIPRFEENAWSQPISGRTSVGFNERGVFLGEMGDVSEEGGEVLQVRYLDRATGADAQVVLAPLLRGMSLTQYVREASGKSKWSPGDPSERLVLENRTPSIDVYPIEQEITIEPLATDTLFAVTPIQKLDSSDELFYNSHQERLFRSRRASRTRYTYRLATSALKNGHQQRLLRVASAISPEMQNLTKEQAPELTGLSAMAAEAVANIPPDDVYRRATALEALLRDSGRFTYSLNPPPADPSIDPVEDFVTRRRAGHCEYFASALALMLRSQGIASRVVVGFRGGEYNPLGHFYQVRQRHAHTWVEARLEARHIPDDLNDGFGGNGAWLMLDPTPGADDAESVTEAASRWPTLPEIWGYIKFLWSSYVVGLNATKQREQIYRPLLNAIGGLVQGVFDLQRWGEFWSDVRAFLSGEGSERLARWFDWRAGVASVIALTLLALTVRWIVVPIARRLGWRRAEQGPGRQRAAPVVDFYRRLEHLLARHAFVRSPADTQREFALSVGGQLADSVSTHAAAALPRQVAEAFYRVRFGGASLDSRESVGLELALDTLEHALNQPSPAHGDTKSK